MERCGRPLITRLLHGELACEARSGGGGQVRQDQHCKKNAFGHAVGAVAENDGR